MSLIVWRLPLRQDSLVSKQPQAFPSLQDELWKAVKDHPTLAMSAALCWGRESGASCQWGGGSSSSLFSSGFHLARDNTNSHFQADEVNGLVGQLSHFKTYQRIKTRQYRTHGGDGQHWTWGTKQSAEDGSPTHGLQECLVCAKPCRFTLAGNPSISCLSSFLSLQWSFSQIIFPLWIKVPFPQNQSNAFQSPDMQSQISEGRQTIKSERSTTLF